MHPKYQIANSIKFLCSAMNDPFYGNYYYPAREVPLFRRETKPARKLIHVPVTDGSEKLIWRRVDAAVKIQKVFRGFMVRKSVKKIAAIKAEVDEMEKWIMSGGTIELIKKDRKERLKINEMLMRLLLKLDSVPGVDFGVRDCRKAVIRKAIRLQEVVDTIADESIDRSSDSSESERNRNSNVLNGNESPEIYESEVRDVPETMDVEPRRLVEEENAPEIEVNVAKLASELTSISNLPENKADQNRGIPSDSADVHVAISGSVLNSISNLHNNADQNHDFPSEAPEVNFVESVPKSTSNPNSPETDADWNLTIKSSPDAVESEPPAAKTQPAFNEYAESMDLSQDESQTGSSADPDEHEESDSDSEKRENGGELERDEAKGGDDGKNIQLLEKLVEDNEKMMGLMADLFKKNEMQTQLLSSLSYRVEHLEKALMCERFRRKKKRN